MLFEIVNPSSIYTIEATSLDVAVMTAILLGQGQYSFKSLDGGEDVPFFAFGGGDEWCQAHFSESLMEFSNRVMDTKLREVGNCFDSVLYGDVKDRVEFLAETGYMDREAFVAARHARQDEKCSSMNDIGERAYRMAANIRESIEDGMKTLQ